MLSTWLVPNVMGPLLGLCSPNMHPRDTMRENTGGNQLPEADGCQEDPHLPSRPRNSKPEPPSPLPDGIVRILPGENLLAEQCLAQGQDPHQPQLIKLIYGLVSTLPAGGLVRRLGQWCGHRLDPAAHSSPPLPAPRLLATASPSLSSLPHPLPCLS